jgi:hypothetical protein
MTINSAETLASITFILFVISILWIGWIPQKYLFNNMKAMNFDLERDVRYYIDTIRRRANRPIGKIVIFYIIFYSAINLIMFIYKLAT